LRLDDDLVLLVDCGYSGIALHYTFAGSHLGRLVVGAVALACAVLLHTRAIVRVRSEPLTDLRGFLSKALDSSGIALLLGCAAFTLSVARLMLLHHIGDRRFHLGGFPFEVRAQPAPGLGGIAR